MKRGRNQRRRQGVNPNRAYDSNGPDVRIRGTAQQIYDKYLALARDAASSGDRVKAENYLQHAEHYFRVLRAMQPAQFPQGDQNDYDTDGDQPGVGGDPRFESRDPREPRPDEQRSQQRAAPEAEAQGEADDAGEDDQGAEAPEGEAGEAGEGGADRTARRRRRRPRRPREDGAEGQPRQPEPAAAE